MRVGYVVADWPVLSRMVAMKSDGGTGALEQMLLAEFAPNCLDSHIDTLRNTFRTKRDAMVSALKEHFGPLAKLSVPRGGIFIWVTLPEAVDTNRLVEAAIAEGVAVNPGSDWSADPQDGRHSLRLCFGNPSVDNINQGVARLAKICLREFPAVAQEPMPLMPA